MVEEELHYTAAKYKGHGAEIGNVDFAHFIPGVGQNVSSPHFAPRPKVGYLTLSSEKSSVSNGKFRTAR